MYPISCYAAISESYRESIKYVYKIFWKGDAVIVCINSQMNISN
jgi:hypothetical protein